MEEVAPLIIYEETIRLQGVLDLLASAVFLLQRHSLTVEVDTGNERLAAVPTEGDDGHFDGFKILLDVQFQKSIVHDGLMATVDGGLIQIVAVSAAEIASRANGFHQGGEGAGLREFLRGTEGYGGMGRHGGCRAMGRLTDL